MTLWIVAHQAPQSIGFSRQYWSGLPFPSPRDLPHRGIKPGSSALQADALTSEPSGKQQEEPESKQQAPLLAYSLREGKGKPVSCVRVGMCLPVRPEGWLRCFAHSLGGGVCRGLVQYPVFAQGSSDVAVGFWVSLYLLGPEFISPTHAQLFVVPYSFPYRCV